MAVWKTTFPTCYFMSSLREMISTNKIKLNFYYKDEKYLSDAIADDMRTPVTREELRKKYGCIIQLAKHDEKADPEANHWDAEKPVIISAQTGKGKNYWVFNDLLPQLLARYGVENDEILLLSNRIAASRQSKIQVADLLKSYIGDNEYERKIQDIYSCRGIDEMCFDFGVITICTYHQMLQRQLLRRKKFRYIICDECHFFTSDAMFNTDTNNMLQEIVTCGRESVRVYMSATPEVAFEAIVRAEFSLFLDRVAEAVAPLEARNDEFRERIKMVKDSPFNKQYLGVMEMWNRGQVQLSQQQYDDLHRNCWLIHIAQRSSPNPLDKDYMDVPPEYLPFPEEQIRRVRSQYSLEIDFYYMPRCYDYIEKICGYDNDEDLLEYIKSSTEKWIVFVHSEAEGERLRAKLIEDKIVPADECIFISRPVIELADDEKVEFDFIIANETTSKRVLITTCVLDNGINIKNPPNANKTSKILNVAISSYDRTQFIQMLGRVRDNQTDKIKLYIKKFPVEKLKQFITRDAEALVKRLANDFYSLEEKKSHFDSRMFVFSPDAERFSSYNPCAIYQLIDQMTRLLRIIRKTDSDFFIQVRKTLEGLKEKVHWFYRFGRTDCIWDRSVLELLDTEIHHKDVERAIDNAIAENEDWTRYESKLDDTFTRYLFSDLLAKRFLTVMQDKYNSYLDERLGTKNLNRYNAKMANVLREEIIASELSTYNRAVLCYKQCELLKQLFRDKFRDIPFNYLKECVDLVDYYEKIANDDKYTSFFEEQLRWIEKSLDDCDFEPNLPVAKEELTTFIQNNSITTDELKQNTHRKSDGTDSKYYDHEFLEAHGIPKGSDRAEELAQTYFEGQSLSDCIGKTITLADETYTLKSANSNKSGHPTYYLLIKQ